MKKKIFLSLVILLSCCKGRDYLYDKYSGSSIDLNVSKDSSFSYKEGRHYYSLNSFGSWKRYKSMLILRSNYDINKYPIDLVEKNTTLVKKGSYKFVVNNSGNLSKLISTIEFSINENKYIFTKFPFDTIIDFKPNLIKLTINIDTSHIDGELNKRIISECKTISNTASNNFSLKIDLSNEMLSYIPLNDTLFFNKNALIWNKRGILLKSIK